MSAWGDIKPAGYAATAELFLEEAAHDGGGPGNLAVRQLAALQGIGYALLALGEQLGDRNDVAVQCGEHVADVAEAIGGLYLAPFGARVLGLLAQLRGGR